MFRVLSYMFWEFIGLLAFICAFISVYGMMRLDSHIIPNWMAAGCIVIGAAMALYLWLLRLEHSPRRR